MGTRVATAAIPIVMLSLTEPAFSAGRPAATPAGVPLDTPWKVRIYKLAHARFLHPAWGWQHSERSSTDCRLSRSTVA